MLKIDDLPIATSELAWSRILHVGRARIARAIRDGELEASRASGKRTKLITRSAIARWLERTRVAPSDFARTRVEEVLARQSRRA